MTAPTNQLFADIDFLVDEMGMTADQCDQILHACDQLGGISAEYFCEEFIFESETHDEFHRLHCDDNYLKINWRLD